MGEASLSERLYRVALTGLVQEDDPNVIADAQARIAKLEKERENCKCGASGTQSHG